MAITLFQCGNHRIHFDDNTSILITLTRESRGLIAEKGHQHIILSDAMIQFGKKITKVVEEAS